MNGQNADSVRKVFNKMDEGKIVRYLHVSQKALLLCEELEKTIDFFWGLFGDDFEMLKEMENNKKQILEKENVRI